ncbi:MAG TPA: hypothetical protein VFV14_02200 [Myxococcaceae bacterium]|nr:hypothetical protein [Myxococcaceae bacterium]
MKTSRVVVGLVLFLGSAAFADQTVAISSAAPEKTGGLYNALEIGIAAGYSQGVGNVGSGVPSLTDSGGPGTSLELDVGWRIDPHFLVGVYGSGAWFSTGDAPGNAFNNWSATAGVQGNYHFLPGESFDPWVGLGTGWRGYWVNRPEGRDSRHGLDLARVQVGVDVPVASGITVSPFIGATATLFLTQQLAQESSFSDIQDRKVNVFLNAGVMGRFDLLGSSGKATQL